MISEPVSPQSVPPYFLQEASELLQQMDSELQTLRQDFNIRKVHTLMRIAHTLKGAAASVGLDAIKTTTHSMEDAFKALCAPDATLTVAVEGLIFDSYACLQLLLSAQFTNTPLDEASILDRMAGIVTELQENLGDQFGNDGYLPSSAELGFDMTQSIFETGITERLSELQDALQHPDPDSLFALLEAQSEIFYGLSESLSLPGFGEIALATQAALKHHPEKVVEIAQAALVDYRAGKAQVLDGDRTRGGTPGAVLQSLSNPSAPPSAPSAPAKSPLKVVYQQPAAKPNRVGKLWQMLTRPIPGTPQLLNNSNASAKAKDSDAFANPPETATQSSAEPVAPPEESPAFSAAEDTSVLPTLDEPFQADEDFYEEAPVAPMDIPEALQIGTPAPPTKPAAVQMDVPMATTVIDTLERSSALIDSLENEKVTQQPSTVPTLRVSVDNLDQLNYMIGELLTQQNRQALYHEELSTGLKYLAKRILQQQKHLYELQGYTLQERLKQTVQNHASQVSQAAEVSSPYQFDTLEF
ncbi:MAG: Hpt domain-containing protein, partial [Cyanobacteria bacterium J06642_11]